MMRPRDIMRLFTRSQRAEFFAYLDEVFERGDGDIVRRPKLLADRFELSLEVARLVAGLWSEVLSADTLENRVAYAETYAVHEGR